MAIKEQTVMVYECDACAKKVVASDDKSPEGFAGDVSVNFKGVTGAFAFYSCGRAHVAPAVKAAYDAFVKAQEPGLPPGETAPEVAPETSDTSADTPPTPDAPETPASGKPARQRASR